MWVIAQPVRCSGAGGLGALGVWGVGAGASCPKVDSGQTNAMTSVDGHAPPVKLSNSHSQASCFNLNRTLSIRLLFTIPLLPFHPCSSPSYYTSLSMNSSLSGYFDAPGTMRACPTPGASQRNLSGSHLSQPQTQQTQQNHPPIGRERRPG